MTRLVVLISGNGSNLQAILDACQQTVLAAEVVAVVSNKADAFGLERARKSNIPTIVLPTQTDRILYDKQLADAVSKYKPDWIILAGWMCILTSAFINRFPDKIINLHPALPGAFPGIHSIQRAWSAFQNKEIEHTGIMVHRVPDEGVDCGPVLAQEIVPIYENDTLEMLAERVHETEHLLLIKTLQTITTGNL